MPDHQNLEHVTILSKPGTDKNIIKPTIFDVISQENMHHLFRLSFNHFLKWISVNYPFINRIRKYSDEIYLLIHSAVEYLYLKSYDALFSEYFYGLKRHNLKSDKKRILSILFSIVVPYLKAKMDYFYEELEKNLDSPNTLQTPVRSNETILVRLKILFEKLTLKLYPYFHLFWSFLFWYYRFKFMINKSEFNSPLLSVIGIKLVYDLNRKNFLSNEKSLLKFILNLSNICFTNLLFFIQFLKWYQDYNDNRSYSNDSNLLQTQLFNNNEKNNEENIIPPPKLSDKLINSKYFKILSDKNLCPLCNKKRTNECVLTVSGFVFCYPCIYKFIKINQRCPITNFPCKTKNIIRIYVSE